MDETYRPKSIIIFFLQICFLFFTTDDRLLFSPVLNWSEKHEASEKRLWMKSHVHVIWDSYCAGTKTIPDRVSVRT